MRRLRAGDIGSISAWLPSRRSTAHHSGARLIRRSGQVRSGSETGSTSSWCGRYRWNGRWLPRCRFQAGWSSGTGRSGNRSRLGPAWTGPQAWVSGDVVIAGVLFWSGPEIRPARARPATRGRSVQTPPRRPRSSCAMPPSLTRAPGRAKPRHRALAPDVPLSGRAPERVAARPAWRATVHCVTMRAMASRGAISPQRRVLSRDRLCDRGRFWSSHILLTCSARTRRTRSPRSSRRPAELLLARAGEPVPVHGEPALETGRQLWDRGGRLADRSRSIVTGIIRRVG